jgi:hypothetical protein
LLLESRLSLNEICEALHAKGYTFRHGRPFVRISKTGKRICAANNLSSFFHNWFYAGWVVSEAAGIAPKTVRGQWPAIVSTEEFERGLEILAKRNVNRNPNRKHFYLLNGLVFIELDGIDELIKLISSTSNVHRSGGGTKYYCVRSSDINFLCENVDKQVIQWLHNIQLDETLLPELREAYAEELGKRFGSLPAEERKSLEKALKEIDKEEERVLRLFALGRISEAAWDGLWQDWQNRRNAIRINLEGLNEKAETHLANLDDAISIISRVGVLFKHLESSKQRDLLREMLERVVVNRAGEVICVKLKPPFAYIQDLIQRQWSEVNSGETKTSISAGECSVYVLSSTPDKNRTCAFGSGGQRSIR